MADLPYLLKNKFLKKKIMKKLLFACLALSIAATSCKKSKDDVVEPAHKNLLTKRTDSDGLVFNYIYDANNRMVTWTRTSNPSNPAENISFTYNANGTLAQWVETLRSIKTKFTYNGDGTVSTKKAYSVFGATETLNDTYTYSYAANAVTENYVQASTGNGFRQEYKYDANGNVTEIKSYNTTPANPAGTYSGIITYGAYDNKNHYNSSAPAAFLFPYSIKNNAGTIVYPSGTGNYTFEYNADAYPTKRFENGTLYSTFEYQRL
jgi:YD repeat-containing protein